MYSITMSYALCCLVFIVLLFVQKMFGHAVNINRTVATATWTAPAQNAGDVEFQ